MAQNWSPLNNLCVCLQNSNARCGYVLGEGGGQESDFSNKKKIKDKGNSCINHIPCARCLTFIFFF